MLSSKCTHSAFLYQSFKSYFKLLCLVRTLAPIFSIFVILQCNSCEKLNFHRAIEPILPPTYCFNQSCVKQEEEKEESIGLLNTSANWTNNRIRGRWVSCEPFMLSDTLFDEARAEKQLNKKIGHGGWMRNNSRLTKEKERS